MNEQNQSLSRLPQGPDRSRRKGGWVIVVAVVLTIVSCVLAYIAAEMPPEGIGKWEFDVVGRQLAGLKTQLHNYRQRHGRYPSNDEGLSVLDGFESRFVVYCSPHVGSKIGVDWKVMPSQIKLMRENGPIKDARGLQLPGVQTQPDQGLIPIEAAIGSDNNLFFITLAGVMTPWMTPYVTRTASASRRSGSLVLQPTPTATAGFPSPWTMASMSIRLTPRPALTKWPITTGRSQRC